MCIWPMRCDSAVATTLLFIIIGCYSKVLPSNHIYKFKLANSIYTCTNLHLLLQDKRKPVYLFKHFMVDMCTCACTQKMYTQHKYIQVILFSPHNRVDIFLSLVSQIVHMSQNTQDCTNELGQSHISIF